MTDIIVNTITDTVVVEEDGLTTVITIGEQGPPGPSGIENIADALDVDATNKVEGSVLVYSTQSQKWVATNELSNQIIESGQY